MANQKCFQELFSGLLRMKSCGEVIPLGRYQQEFRRL